jgi:hypothetical protein
LYVPLLRTNPKGGLFYFGAKKMNETFLQKLAERQAAAEPEAEPVQMIFDGVPCKARPLSLEFYIRSGRMPDYLARIALSGCHPQAVERELATVTTEALLAGQKFQRVAVCHVLKDEGVVDCQPEQTPEGAISYTTLAESSPKFVDAVFAWVMMGCPLPAEGGEGAGDESAALETFSAKSRRRKRAGVGRDGKAKRTATSGAAAVADPERGAQV